MRKPPSLESSDEESAKPVSAYADNAEPESANCGKTPLLAVNALHVVTWIIYMVYIKIFQTSKVITRPPLLRPGLGIDAPAGGCVGARHTSPVWRGPRNACIWRLGSPNVRAAYAPLLQPVGA